MKNYKNNQSFPCLVHTHRITMSRETVPKIELRRTVIVCMCAISEQRRRSKALPKVTATAHNTTQHSTGSAHACTRRYHHSINSAPIMEAFRYRDPPSFPMDRDDVLADRSQAIFSRRGSKPHGNSHYVGHFFSGLAYRGFPISLSSLSNTSVPLYKTLA